MIGAQFACNGRNLFFTFCIYFVISQLVNRVTALECYVCTNQPDNKDKCVETVKTCDGDEERCLNEVRWGSLPYWAPSGEKQYYISKRCASIKTCDDWIRNLTRRCDRIWYNDWECVECCQGDRCNYYVTLSANFDYPNVILLIISLIFALVFNR